MEPVFQFDERILYALACIMGSALLLALVVAVYVFSRIRRVRLPPDADAITALRLTPLSVVILLDLLDLGLDFLAAPFAWAILTRLGLGPLRGVTVLESLIPGTQALPTMTAAWLFVRLFRRPARTGTSQPRRLQGR